MFHQRAAGWGRGTGSVARAPPEATGIPRRAIAARPQAAGRGTRQDPHQIPRENDFPAFGKDIFGSTLLRAGVDTVSMGIPFLSREYPLLSRIPSRLAP